MVCELSSANTCAFQLMKYFHCLLQSTHFLLVSCPCSISLIYFLALHHLLFAPGRLCGLCHGNPDCSDDGCLRPSFASSTDPVTCAHLVPSFVSKNTELVCCLETSCGFLSPFCPLLCVIHCYFVFTMNVSIVIFPLCQNMCLLDPILIIAVAPLCSCAFSFSSRSFHQVPGDLHFIVQWILADDEEVRLVLFFKVVKPCFVPLADLFFEYEMCLKQAASTCLFHFVRRLLFTSLLF